MSYRAPVEKSGSLDFVGLREVLADGTRGAPFSVTSMTHKTLFSSLGVLVAAFASVATSQPPPDDWELDDSTLGDVTLSPEEEEVTVKFRVVSEVVDSQLDFNVRLDPQPAREPELADTPIAFFVGVPEEGGGASSVLVPIPNEVRPSGPSQNDRVSSTVVPAGRGAREFIVRIAWSSPDEAHQARPMAARAPMKIHWDAAIHADGDDGRPDGAKLDLEPVR